MLQDFCKTLDYQCDIFCSMFLSLPEDMLIKVVRSSTAMPSVEGLCMSLEVIANLSDVQRAAISFDKHAAYTKIF